MTQKTGEFQLPTTFTILVSSSASGSSIAHALDCDLVCESETQEKAIEKLKLALKSYIEFGIENGWTQDVLFPAPEEFWQKAAKATTLGPPILIKIDNASILCHVNESKKAA